VRAGANQRDRGGQAGHGGTRRREQILTAEITRLEAALTHLTSRTAPRLVATFGAGPDVAGALLCAAGDNPGRLRNEPVFARLCGAAPLEGSSGRTRRHRLNPGGDRQANNALWRIVLVRMHHDPRTRPTSPAAPPKDCPNARSSAA
jgi:transposase